jgi:hypothetical protein
MKWKTASGHEIDVADMTDSHLTNTLRMLRRNSPLRARVAEVELMDYINDAPDGAADCAQQELDALQGSENVDAPSTDAVCAYRAACKRPTLAMLRRAGE